MPGWNGPVVGSRSLAAGLLLALAALGHPVSAASPPDETRARKLAATGIPGLCAERFEGDPAREHCVERQLEAGRRIRAILLANRGDAELEGTIERCAAGAASPEGAYDWVRIKDCTDVWLRGAARERSR